ncbi:MAG TPA: ABC transporter permease [Candidatus Baltobacteraceae bacterium]
MNVVTLVGAHTRAMLTDLKRTPGYVIPTLAFPTMFFAIFALPYAHTAAIADSEMLSYMAFAIIGVTLFQFGVGIAAERGRPWERYLRTLPCPPAVRFVARTGCAMAFGLAAAALVALVARIFTPLDFNALQWLQLIGYAFVGGIPFVLFGITIGYWVSARAAIPVANICYLLLSFAGGLWIPPQYLPGFAARISPYLPTRQFGELLWSIKAPGHVGQALIVLAAYTVFFAALASVGYRRDERTRYA